MAQRKQHMGERIIEADNGFGWSRKPSTAALSIQAGLWQTEIFGITYTLEKFDFPERGWCLYSLGKPSHFWGEFITANLLPSIDKASEMIAEADLRGPGYERTDA